MSVLRNLESRIADLVEGAFGRAFRSEVRPVELARRLTRTMDAHRRASLSSTHVPSAYVIWLSPEDRRRLTPIEPGLVEELCAYLLEHARAERLALGTPPHVELRTDPRLALGECEIEAASGQSEAAAPRRAGSQAARPSATEAYLSVGGTRHTIGVHGAVIGRSPDCDIVLSSSEVSRRHAEVVPSGDGWLLVDLGSTNGVRLNARTVGVPTLLTDGDVIEIGASELTFEAN
jgi:FhaA, N-terminal domain/FHA domain